MIKSRNTFMRDLMQRCQRRRKAAVHRLAIKRQKSEPYWYHWRAQRNPFFLFLSDYRNALKQKCPDHNLKVTTVSTLAAEHWRTMCPEDKLVYTVWAAQNRVGITSEMNMPPLPPPPAPPAQPSANAQVPVPKKSKNQNVPYYIN